MGWVILIIGFLIIIYCLAILAAPRTARRTIDFFFIGSRLYLAGFIRLVLGVGLLFLSSYTKLWGYVVTIGLLAAASGLSIFFFPLRRTKKVLSRIQNQSDTVLRLWTIVALAIWSFLIYAIVPLH